MKFILENWHIIIPFIVAGGGIVYFIYYFIKPSKKQMKKVKEWLYYAVVKAEKELGSGTGEIKLRYVYSMFMEKFPKVAKVISFENFTALVDEALHKAKKYLNTKEEGTK